MRAVRGLPDFASVREPARPAVRSGRRLTAEGSQKVRSITVTTTPSLSLALVLDWVMALFSLVSVMISRGAKCFLPRSRCYDHLLSILRQSRVDSHQCTGQ